MLNFHVHAKNLIFEEDDEMRPYTQGKLFVTPHPNGNDYFMDKNTYGFEQLDVVFSSPGKYYAGFMHAYKNGIVYVHRRVVNVARTTFPPPLPQP